MYDEEIKTKMSHAEKRQKRQIRRYKQLEIFLSNKRKDAFVSGFNSYPTIFRKHYEQLIIFLNKRYIYTTLCNTQRIKRHDVSAILLFEKIKKGFFDYLGEEDDEESPRIQEEYFDDYEEESNDEDIVNDRRRVNLRKRNARKK